MPLGIIKKACILGDGYYLISRIKIQVSQTQTFGGMVGWCEGVLYLTAPGRPIDIGLQLGKACYPCSR